MIRTRSLLLGVAVATLTLTHFQVIAETDVEEAQRLYREHCRHCHDDGAAAGEYTPVTLIQSQWERFFKRKYERTHRKVMDDMYGGVPVTEAISADDLAKISTFTIDHAADTDRPMTCD